MKVVFDRTGVQPRRLQSPKRRHRSGTNHSFRALLTGNGILDNALLKRRSQLTDNDNSSWSEWGAWGDSGDDGSDGDSFNKNNDGRLAKRPRSLVLQATSLRRSMLSNIFKSKTNT